MKIFRSVIAWIVVISSLYLCLDTTTGLEVSKVHQNSIDTYDVEDVWDDTWSLHELIAHFLQRQFRECHMLIMRENSDISITPLLKTLETWDHPLIVVDASESPVAKGNASNSAKDVLDDKFFIGNPRIKCRVGVIYLNDAPDDTLMRFLEEADFWKHPSMKMIAIGPKDRRHEFLLHHSLRNVIHSLYFVPVLKEETIEDATGIKLYPAGGKWLYPTANPEYYIGVDIYFHCFFCENGNSKIIYIERWSRRRRWTAGQNLFPDQFKNFNGHEVRIVTMPFFPFINFIPDSDEPRSTVTLTESLDFRMLTAISKILNFTYDIRIPIDNEWAQPLDNGSWTGIVGTLQREDADFSTSISNDYFRNQASDFTRHFVPEPLVIVSRKAKPLPPYLAIVKPFSEIMWGGIAIAFTVAGIAFWILQNRWEDVSIVLEDATSRGKVAKWEACPEYFDFTDSIFFTWALLLQQQPYEFPPHLHGRLWVAWWLIFSLLVVNIYRSALIASLSVPQMSEPVDSFEQLTERTGWTSGMEPHFSVAWLWMKTNPNPGVQKIFKDLEYVHIPEQMSRIAEQGDHAFISYVNYIRNIIISKYTDKNGYTPMYISRRTYTHIGCGWATRRGVPYYRIIDNLQQRFVEGNFLELWLDVIFRETLRKSREQNTTSTFEQEEEGQVVFSLFHMQGAFYILFFGLVISTPVFLMEYYSWKRSLSTKRISGDDTPA